MRCLLRLSVLAILSYAGAHARAQEGGEKLKLGAAMLIDFAGGIEYDPPGRANNVNDDALVTPGLRLHVDYDVHRYVSVGGLLRFGFWRAEERDESRNLLVDLAARVSGHYDYRDFRFYGVFALGPSFDRLRDENLRGLENPGIGAAISLAPGVAWWFARRFALFTEIFGWSAHFLGHGYVGSSSRMQVRLNQVLWQVGMLFGV